MSVVRRKNVKDPFHVLDIYIPVHYLITTSNALGLEGLRMMSYCYFLIGSHDIANIYLENYAIVVFSLVNMTLPSLTLAKNPRSYGYREFFPKKSIKKIKMTHRIKTN